MKPRMYTRTIRTTDNTGCEFTATLYVSKSGILDSGERIYVVTDNAGNEIAHAHTLAELKRQMSCR